MSRQSRKADRAVSKGIKSFKKNLDALGLATTGNQTCATCNRPINTRSSKLSIGYTYMGGGDRLSFFCGDDCVNNATAKDTEEYVKPSQAARGNTTIKYGPKKTSDAQPQAKKQVKPPAKVPAIKAVKAGQVKIPYGYALDPRTPNE